MKLLDLFWLIAILKRADILNVYFYHLLEERHFPTFLNDIRAWNIHRWTSKWFYFLLIRRLIAYFQNFIFTLKSSWSVIFSQLNFVLNINANVHQVKVSGRVFILVPYFFVRGIRHLRPCNNHLLNDVILNQFPFFWDTLSKRCAKEKGRGFQEGRFSFPPSFSTLSNWINTTITFHTITFKWISIWDYQHNRN